MDGFDNSSGSTRADPAVERSERLKREAIAWLSLLSSGAATVADAEALKRWVREDPAHGEAYAKVALVWDMLTPVAADAQVPVATPPGRTQPVRRDFGRRAVLGGALAASAVGVTYALIRPPLDLWPSLAELRADIRTGIGEQRQIEIADGVKVDLNTRSSLSLRKPTNNGRNHVELVSGEAIFVAGSDAAGDCVVTAGEGRVVVHDARVDVRHDDARIRVACLAGGVRVEHDDQTINLPAGEQVVYDAQTISGMGAFDPTIVAAWQDGRLVFKGEALSRVIDEVNRYRPGHIVLLDETLGHHLIDASFNLDRLDNVVVYLQQAFDAKITKLPGGLVLVG